jgi:hypothetical protein
MSKSQRQSRLQCGLSLFLFCIVTALTVSCNREEPRQPDLPQQPYRWVSSITLDPDSKLWYMGETKKYVITTVSSVGPAEGPRTISVGEEIEGLRIGAIRCLFNWRDEFHRGKQVMWRGRWGCTAGRSRHELESRQNDDREKFFDYLFVGPIRLADAAPVH